MLKDIFMIAMIIKMIMKIIDRKKIQNNLILFFILFISSCSISPGMHMSPSSSWLDDKQYVYIDSIEEKILIKNIHSSISNSFNNETYKIGTGDQISVTIWGLPEVFPIVNTTPDQNLRRVDSNGNIFFPYAGLIKASGKTQDQLRADITNSLSLSFTNPQVDVSISRFNSQKVFILGEVTRPKKLNITDVPLTLSDAIGESFGINTNTASGSEVFVIRQTGETNRPEIFIANLSTPAGFVGAGEFFLVDNDIVYVNANGTTRWNKVISQFFPFSSFLNSVDNLTND